jgi:hypothetical protein
LEIGDSVVVPVSSSIQNRAIVLIDGLELSIIWNAPFAAVFMEVYLI